MASRPFYSGDMAALNDAAAAYERNQIAARSGNQAYLSQLANVALQRRGQDVQERQAAADRDNRMALAQLTDSGNRYAVDQQGALGRQRNANDLLKTIQDNEQALSKIMVERDRIAALERQGIMTNQLEKDRLEAAGRQIAAELTNRMEIAKLQFSPENRRVDSRIATEIIAGNAAIDESNQQAAGLAEVLNSRIGKQGGFLGMGRDNADDIFRGLTPEQAALVQIVEDAKKNRSFGVRPRHRLGMDGRPVMAPPAAIPPAPVAAPRTNQVFQYNDMNAGPTPPQFSPTLIDALNSGAYR